MLTEVLCKDHDEEVYMSHSSVVEAQQAISNKEAVDVHALQDLIYMKLVECPELVATVASILTDNNYVFVPETETEDMHVKISLV